MDPCSESGSHKEKLLEEIHRSRQAVARDWHAFREELNLRSKLQTAVRARPAAWLGGAALTGFLLAGGLRCPRRNKTAPHLPHQTSPSPGKASPPAPAPWAALMATLKFAVPLLKPLIQVYASKRLAKIAESLK